MTSKDDLLDLIDALKAKGIDPKIIVHYGTGSGGTDPGPGPGPDPDPPPSGKTRYKVDASMKASKRHKVRATANVTAGEVDYVYHDEIVLGPGRVVNGFVYVDERESGDPIIPGFVEQEHLTTQ